ncbi:DsbC family protein [Candidatus Venteria ishoeyi]|uniref:Thiol:disulfide interchange protein n=1 Tax=Candidatus Venteria ishoeyi TaxID=1899563 RepID=A0A1H6FD02_9GAMM|nr:DsbC family protein [Candidatus Venteria ishoeyi]MDM8546096.1 DsbC family protein [Candidatus Venteria ishoeyi]SEH07970.1 Thiol:disulfide interchange protein DsbC precursor [Candidatus Venteria ishoeyi]
MRLLIGLITLCFSLNIHAENAPPAIQEALKQLLGPQANIDKIVIQKAPVAGLYEAVLDNYIFYATEDGRYIIRGGDILDLKQEGRNLTEERRNGLRLNVLNQVSDKEMIIFKPEGKTKHTLTAFTDVDCFYCAKLHKEVPALNKAGVEVRYLAFPRSGPRSKTYNTMVSVWCAEDPLTAMTDAKAGKSIAEKTCANPVTKEYDIGRQMGVSGTPALLMPNGELLPGYAPADKLVQYLEAMK